MTDWPVRRVDACEIEALADVWHDAWHDAHACCVPADLTAIRTHASFRERLNALGDAVRTIGAIGAPAGLCAIQDDQLYQIYVSRNARGTGAAVALLEEGERRLAANGIRKAWLDCVIQNTRAIRFYTRQGWVDSGTHTATLAGLGTDFPLKVRVFRKILIP
ncbi:MAG: GNAT family N-acetyltransferase [Paracoccaceae bacterium]